MMNKYTMIAIGLGSAAQLANGQVFLNSLGSTLYRTTGGSTDTFTLSADLTSMAVNPVTGEIFGAARTDSDGDGFFELYRLDDPEGTPSLTFLGDFLEENTTTLSFVDGGRLLGMQAVPGGADNSVLIEVDLNLLTQSTIDGDVGQRLDASGFDPWPEADRTDERVASIDGEKEARYRSIVADAFPVMDGAVELIDSLVAEGFLIGAGSSGPPENVHLALKNIGRVQCFGAVVTSVDVKEGKPNPEVFAKCAERLGLSPSRCVVIEDAPAGVLAARRAGMRSVALLSTGRGPADFEGTPPDKMVKNLQNLSPSTLAQTILERC